MKNAVIIFYDGECGFCNHWVSFFLKQNPGYFYFATLQGTTASELLGENYPLIQQLSTLAVKTPRGELLTRSTAALFLFSLTSQKRWHALGYFKFIPTFIRDGAYRLISALRHRLSASSYCVMPTPEQQQFFLD